MRLPLTIPLSPSPLSPAYVVKGKDRNKLECVAWIAAALSGADETWGQGTQRVEKPTLVEVHQTKLGPQPLHMALCFISLYALGRLLKKERDPIQNKEEEGQVEGRG